LDHYSYIENRLRKENLPCPIKLAPQQSYFVFDRSGPHPLSKSESMVQFMYYKRATDSIYKYWLTFPEKEISDYTLMLFNKYEEKISKEEKILVNTARNIMILGWNTEGYTIVKQMDNYVMKDSEVCIVSDDADRVRADLDNLMPLKNITIIYLEADIGNRKALNQLPLQNYQHLMILSYSDKMHIQEADAITLVALMHLREIKKNKKLEFSIISEMSDIKNRTLAEVAKPDDFIISDHVISLIVSQVAENKELKLVFDELFDAQGSELYLKPVDLYVQPEVEVNFYTVVGAALKRNEIAVGYRLKNIAENPALDYGIILNPKKHEKITFQKGDKIIVLAEDL
jgi:hypothetical protein